MIPAREPIEHTAEVHVDTPSIPIKKQSPKISAGIIIFTVLVFIAFVFCLAGNTIGMFNSRTNSSCYSIWGYKPRCLGSWFVKVEFRREDGRTCEKSESLIQAAQAFSVMCIIGGFLTTCVAILELLHFAELAIVCIIMSVINTVATLVVWSTMIALYWSNQCHTRRFPHEYRIGPGLALYISAWCLQMVADAVLIVDIYLGNAK